MSSSAPQTFITPEEYLIIERAAEFKSEYYDGQMYLMSGVRRPHNLIAANLARVIGNQIVDRPCELYISEMRTRGATSASYMYPDLAAVCADPEFADNEFDVFLNPSLVIEILSPSTEKWDRGGKFARYRQIENLVDYVLITQEKILVERFTRRGAEWERVAYDRLEDILTLDSIGCVVSLADIYAKVRFPDPPPAT